MLRRKWRGRKRGPEAENRHGWSAERRGVPIARDAGVPRKRPDLQRHCRSRCLASTGRLSALRPPLTGWKTGKTRAQIASRERVVLR